MRRIIEVLALFTILFMGSCTKEGPVGPQGPQGPVGPEGPIGPQGPSGFLGEDDVVSYSVLIYSSCWEWVNNCQWMVDIDFPSINGNVYNHGAVLVYMKVGSVWSQVPLTYYYEVGQEGVTNYYEASIDVAHVNGGVHLYWTESDFFDGMRPDKHEFKIVAIEASVYSHRSDVDYSNYEAVKTAFQLAD